MLRVLLADDHPIVLQGLLSLLATEPSCTVVEACRDGEEVLDALGRREIDVLLMDLSMPRRTGLDVLRRLAAEDRVPPTVLLTGSIDDSAALEAIRLGVRGIVLKEEAPRLLLDTVTAVGRGERRIDGALMEQALRAALQQQSQRSPSEQRLTPAELNIVRLVARGLSNKRIAREAGISEATVKIHLHRVFRKLDVGNRVQLTLYAREHGL